LSVLALVAMFTQIAAEQLMVDVLEFVISPFPDGSCQNIARFE
jgi:hypothetical protein